MKKKSKRYRLFRRIHVLFESKHKNLRLWIMLSCIPPIAVGIAVIYGHYNFDDSIIQVEVQPTSLFQLEDTLDYRFQDEEKVEILVDDIPKKHGQKITNFQDTRDQIRKMTSTTDIEDY